MAGQIPQRFIDDLLARVDVVEVVGERVTLKKSGRNYSGLCPFHQEKTPSFTVSQDKQFYHCFGCGAHGNALRFLMEYDNLRFPEAVEQLAVRQGMEVPREGADDPRAQARERKRKEGVNLLELAASFFRERLRMAEADSARAYLERRGLTAEVLADFGIGYAPHDWEALKRHLSEHGIPEAVQVEYGLLVHREDSGRTYDRFRDRVMFPIRDFKGRTIAFGGRVLGDAKPKYLNSPESPVFHKGRELYGLFEARQANRHLERVLIVEGYMDVVALAQFGIRNAVATLGTSTSEEHLSRLFRLVGEVVFCFDGDRAGRQAASRALEIVLPLMIDGRQARFLFLPEGEDPDSLVRREGADAFADRITCASPLSEFLFEQAAVGRDLARIEDRERFASQVLSALQRLPEGVLKSMLLGELAKRSGVEQARFESLLAPVVPTREVDVDDEVYEPYEASAKPVGRADKRPAALGLTGRTLQLLVHEPRLVERLPETLDWCPTEDPDGALCVEVIQLLRAGGYRSPQVLLAHFHGRVEGQRLAELVRHELLIPREARATELEGLVEYFLQQRSRRTPQSEIDSLLARERSGERLSREERQRLMELLTALSR
ncbi:DNA primase [Litchfieldella anticariensis FP35 = DSM 16096]|uniref:DNA primase n=1 Tax=Litchfieldella anticariensis (strain DSM 16096 / CECT 5854 / CIP 108499 / LMG 22089 / FP35) TaxID=1121939 RepID=S2KP68_LITA3|nr:DNA primase [Halomonas anticariensis]EPC02263.1 DNA primase [Halomonas anticariensis FP35 = DSM 16096]